MLTAHRSQHQQRAPLAPLAESWQPPAGPGAELQPAGVHWDAVRVPAYLGDRARRLLTDSGAVIRDHYAHRLYWLVPPGSTSSWEPVPGVSVYGSGCRVEIPPAGRTLGFGPVWLTWPLARLHTAPERLRVTLLQVVEDACSLPGRASPQ